MMLQENPDRYAEYVCESSLARQESHALGDATPKAAMTELGYSPQWVSA
jgi:hypothetical protein